MSGRTEQYVARRCGNVVDRPLDQGTIYLWGCDSETDPPFAALFLCPCGCGEEVNLPLTHDGWKFNGDLQRPDLQPSILWKHGCMSHFYVRDGKVIWV